jgi:Rieske 2Fe-2S family protein
MLSDIGKPENAHTGSKPANGAKPLSPVDPWIRDLAHAYRSGFSLEQPFYNHPRLYTLDLERIWMRYWIYAGHTSRIPNPGDYFLYTMGNESVILIRDENGQVNALANVCRHRGSQLCTDSQGYTKKLVCPYHQWVYDLDGSLRAAKLMPEDLDKAEYGLFRLPCQVLEGFIFISFAEQPPDFAFLVEKYRPHLQMYHMERTKVAYSGSYQVKGNWKLIAENFRECYHCGVGHPEYCSVIIGADLLASRERARQVKAEKLAEWEARGIPTYKVLFDSPQVWYYCERYPYQPGYVTMSRDGDAVAPPLGGLKDPDVGVFSIVQYPNFWLDINHDYAWAMRVTPIGPTLSEVEASWLVHQDAVEGVDYEVDELIWFWKTTAEQDWKLIQDNQAGVNSSYYRPGPYVDVEGGPEQFANWYIAHLA